MPLQSLGERRKNVSLTRLEPERQVESERDWRSYRKPSEQIFYSDTGHGYVKQYQRKPRDFMGRRQPQGVFASDVGVMYGLRPAYPSPPLNREEWLFDLQISEAQKEIKFTRMVSKLDISQEEKERLLSLYVPGAAEAITYGKAVTASHSFYRGLGYPEFGGRYAPFTVPSGAKIQSIVETESGLKITFEGTREKIEDYVQTEDEPLKLPKALGTSAFTESLLAPVEKKVVKEEWLSEQLYNVQMGSELVVTGKGATTQSMRPFAPLAFLIAPAEYFVYGLVTMIRGPDFPSVSTPPSTPTLFTNPVGVIQAGRTAMAASLLGEILLSETIGFGFNVGLETVGKAVSPVSKLVQTSKPYIGARGSYFSFVNWLKNPEPFSENRVFYDVYSDTLKGKSSTSKELLKGTDWLKGESDELIQVVSEGSDDSMQQFTKSLKYEKPQGGFTSRKLPLASEIKIIQPSEEELYTRVFASVSEQPFVSQGTSQVLIMEKPVSKVAVAVSTKELSFAEMTPIPMLQFWTGKAYPFMSSSRRQQEETEIEVLSYPASAMGFAVAKPIGQTDFLQRSRAVQGLSGFEVAPRLKPTTTISTVRTGLFKGLKGSSIMAPKSASRFTQSTNLKPMSLSESGLKLDQGLKQNMAQASRIAEQYQLKQKFQFPEEPFKRKGGRRKRKKAKGGIADWYVVDWPLSKPEDFLKRF